MSGSHTYRVHGILVTVDFTAPAWPKATSADLVDGDPPWTLRIEVSARDRAIWPQPPVGKVDVMWSEQDGGPVVEIRGGREPAVARFVVDWELRRIDVRHSADDRTGALEIVNRWLLPIIARAELGVVPLHGTCVATPHGRVVVVGDSGRGKSSLTAALVLAGSLIVGDEPTCVVADLAGPRVLDGVGLLRIDQATADRLGVGSCPDVAVLEDFEDSADKLAMIGLRPYPHVDHLLAVVILGERQAELESVLVEQLTPSEAFRELFEHRYSRPTLAHNVRADFVHLAPFVSTVPVVRATFPDDLDALAAAAPELISALTALDPMGASRDTP